MNDLTEVFAADGRRRRPHGRLQPRPSQTYCTPCPTGGSEPLEARWLPESQHSRVDYDIAVVWLWIMVGFLAAVLLGGLVCAILRYRRARRSIRAGGGHGARIVDSVGSEDEEKVRELERVHVGVGGKGVKVGEKLPEYRAV